MRSIFKKILYVAICLVILIEGYVLIKGVSETMREYRWQSNYLKFVENLRQPYKEDTYGGKTPEETWAMFMTALEKGDVELASKYFDPDKQSRYKSILLQSQKENVLERWKKDLSTLRKSNNQPGNTNSEVYYSYDYFSKEFNQILTGRVIFLFNSYNKIWKISLL